MVPSLPHLSPRPIPNIPEDVLDKEDDNNTKETEQNAASDIIAHMREQFQVVIDEACTKLSNLTDEKIATIKAYGAEIIVSPSGLSDDHPDSYMNMARTLAAQNEGWFDVNQYDNLDNPEGHYRTLGPEIWSQTVGRVTHFVAGGSTGGTISGTGRFLKSKNPGFP